jgi:transposase
MAREYSQEFREEAIKLGLEIGSSQAAEKLEIPSGTLDCWLYKARKEQKRVSGTGKKEEAASVRELQERIRDMEKEMSGVKKENEFLEEATRFFASRRQK